MIKLVDLILENKTEDYAFHLTKKSNIQSIKQYGLRPSIPVDMPSEEEGVYLFKTREYAEEALMNWYGDRYDDNEEFVLLTIDVSDLRLFGTLVDYEYVCYENIPPKNIVKIENI